MEAYIFFGEEVWFTETLIEELLRNVPDEWHWSIAMCG